MPTRPQPSAKSCHTARFPPHALRPRYLVCFCHFLSSGEMEWTPDSQSGPGGLLFNWTNQLESKTITCCQGCLLSRPSSLGPRDSHLCCTTAERPIAQRFSYFIMHKATWELVKRGSPMSTTVDSETGARPIRSSPVLGDSNARVL